MTKGKRPPGPSGLRQFTSLREFSRDPLGYLTRCTREYGDAVRLRLLHIPVYVLSRPEWIEEVLVTHSAKFIKSADLRETRNILGDGLLTSEGEFWRRQRKLAQPAFHRERIQAYAATMSHYAEQMLATWRPGETRDIHQEMMQLTLKIAAKTLFGTDLTADSIHIIGESLRTVLQNWEARSRTAFLFPAYLPTAGNLRANQARRKLDDILFRIILRRRKSPGDSEDLLSLLLAAKDEAGQGMSDKQLRDEVMTLLLAGHETTAVALAWTFYLLAQNPQADARLAEEFRSLLGKRAPEPSDLPNLRYLECVIRESMRLYPPAWGIGREAAEDCEIGGYFVPRRTNIYIIQWVMHHDGRFFQEPESFQPERWTEEFQKTLPKFAYFPFGGGPRVCIGASFALMEATLLLAAIASRFRLGLASGQHIELWPSITLRPKNGIRVTLYPR